MYEIFIFGVFGVEILKQAPPSFRTDDSLAIVTLNSVRGLFFVSESRGPQTKRKARDAETIDPKTNGILKRETLK